MLPQSGCLYVGSHCQLGQPGSDGVVMTENRGVRSAYRLSAMILGQLLLLAGAQQAIAIEAAEADGTVLESETTASPESPETESQEESGQQTATIGGESNVEQIVVTTRRREENLQEVPISIGVFDSEQIARQGIRDLADITRLSPSVQFDRSGFENSVRVTIRGLSNTRGRSNVAFLVDGIDVTSETTGTNAGSPLLVNQRLLSDVERIEVVRGPQSALFGRAAFAGAINYVSKAPADELEGNVSVDVAQHDQQEYSGGFSMPLTDTLGMRLSGVSWNNEGYYENVVSGEKFGGGDGYALSGTLAWEPVDTLDLTLRTTYSDDEYKPGAVAGIYDRDVTIDVPQSALDNGVTSETSVDIIRSLGDARGLEVSSSEDPLTGGDYPGSSLDVFRTSLIANWEVGAYTLSSYTGYTDADFTQRYDLDRQAEGRPDAFLGHGDVDSYGNTNQLSQELRMASDWQELPVQLTVGALYWHEERDDFSRNIGATCYLTFACGPDQNVSPYQSWQDLYAAIMLNSTALANSLGFSEYRNPINADTDHRSFYLMGEWSINDTWTLVVEDRFVWEDFDASVAIGASCVNPYPYNANFDILGPPTCIYGTQNFGSTSSNYQTPKFTLEWQAAETAMLYALAARGVKPAGISLLQVPAPFDLPLDIFYYDPEKMWSYEVGAKSNWSGRYGNLLFNSALFYQDYKDKQTNTQQQVGQFLTGVVTNASSAWVKGVELESMWETPLQGLSLGFAWTWLDSEYDDFQDATRSATRIAIAGECSEIVVIRNNNHCLLDLDGNELEFLPQNSVVLTMRYGQPLFSTGLDWYIESNGSYQSERYISADNFTELDSFWLVDARFGLSHERWEGVFYITNLFDNETLSSSGAAIDFVGYVEADSFVPPSLSTAFLPPPRTAGLRLKYFFE